MKTFYIVTDAASDLCQDLQQQYDIHVLNGHVVLPDKQEISAGPAWDWCTREEFYRNLKRDPNGYTTSPANISEFFQVMKTYAAEEKPLLVMTISSGISGAYNFALKAREMVLNEYPNAVIACVDSLRFGPGFGLMAVHASLCRENGLSIHETVDYLEQNKNRFHQAGWHDDLSFVAKKGRITHANAFLGKLVGIKPIGEFDYNGLTTVIGKAKGTQNAFGALLRYIENTAERPEEQIFFIAHANRLQQALEYKAMIEERFHPKSIYVNDIYPCCSINTGPGLMAAYYVGKPISADLSEERKLIDSFIHAEA